MAIRLNPELVTSRVFTLVAHLRNQCGYFRPGSERTRQLEEWIELVELMHNHMPSRGHGDVSDLYEETDDGDPTES